MATINEYRYPALAENKRLTSSSYRAIATNNRANTPRIPAAQSVYSAGGYTHPTGDGNSHVPADLGSSDGQVLTATAVTGVPGWSDIDGGTW